MIKEISFVYNLVKGVRVDFTVKIKLYDLLLLVSRSKRIERVILLSKVDAEICLEKELLEESTLWQRKMRRRPKKFY